jgi:hypothetical protein
MPKAQVYTPCGVAQWAGKALDESAYGAFLRLNYNAVRDNTK